MVSTGDNMMALKRGNRSAVRVEKSPLNGELETIAAPLIAVSAFFRRVGMEL